jgi:hypothetical protein
MAMNTKPRLHQPLAFNLIAAVVIGVCFGARPGVAQDSVTGRWDPAIDLPFFPVHSHTLPTGKVMIWPGDGGISGNDPRSWDPANQSVSTLTPPGYDVFCAGHSFLADGRLFVAGGHVQNGVGLANASIYNPSANAWTRLPDMNAGRWYPTVTVLANGDVLVVSGSIDNVVGVNRLPQVFQVGSGWRNLTSAQLGMDLYPQMFLAPNGKVFNSGPTQTTRYLDTAGSGTWSFVANRVGPHRDYGSAVMYAPGKVLVMGGGPPTNTAEVIDLNQPSPTWRAVGSMHFARRQINATLLPDGNVLVTGGTSSAGFNNPAGAVHAAELWNPTTEQWTTLASSDPTIPRVYHSSALLLPDARVLSMGGNGYPQTEIYSPPYLFKGTRPTITSAPASVAYGQSFFVGTPDAAAISKVTMLRLSSVTHAFNMSQYISMLSFSQTTGGLNVVAPSAATVATPSGATVAPPGPYMLFILNGSGVPSVAKIVQVATLNSIAVTPVGPSILTGATQQFTATGTYSNGSTQNITSQVTWASSSTTVATINGSGLATGASAGSTTISAALSGTGVAGSTTLTVQAAPAPAPPVITTPSLPEGRVGSPYSVTLEASGGTQPYTWSLASPLPPLPPYPGLSLSGSGVISGTPTKPGSSSFTARVTDASNPPRPATKAFTIKVRKR